MKIEHYIAELLFHYDCVIVPKFGGFVGNYKPATIQPIQNTFNPPSKQLSFNKNLNSNDGLLANYIAQKEGLDYDAACKKINIFVTETQQQLTLKKTVGFEEIGTLFLDTENRLQFEPKSTNNYLLAAYGLAAFQKFPIKRTTLEDKITKEFKDRTTPLVVVKESKKSTKRLLFAAAITIPIAIFAIWLPSKLDLGSDINFANLNPFTPTPTAIYKERTAPQFEEIKEQNISQQIVDADENTYFLKVSFDENETPIVVKLKEQPVAEPVSTYVATANHQLEYHIIGGCFSSKSNARKMVRKLKKAGFKASIVGKRKGLWTVSYNSFATRKEAVEALADAKDHNGKAWILNQAF